MNNFDKYVNVFVECFEISEEEAKKLNYQDINEWDSVGHMDLIASMEEAFDIMMKTEDIIDFSSFEKGVEIMRKYNILI